MRRLAESHGTHRLFATARALPAMLIVLVVSGCGAAASNVPAEVDSSGRAFR